VGPVSGGHNRLVAIAVTVAVAELEADVLAVLRRDGPSTGPQLAAAIGTSEHIAHVVLGLLAFRRAIATCGSVDGPTDVLGRRSVYALWRAA
jgi:hypothetical protein